MVVLPEWQGAGVGMKFLNEVCRLQYVGAGHLNGRRVTTVFHTSHPQLAAALRRDPKWRQVTASLFGANKARSKASMMKSNGVTASGHGYGGHLRAVQGFRYIGAPDPSAVAA
jgi:hypothetical protein